MSISFGPRRLTATLALAFLPCPPAHPPGSAAPAADPSPPPIPVFGPVSGLGAGGVEQRNGPDIQLTSYKYSDWQEAWFEPARFDNGLFVNHDIGEGWSNDGANFFAINTGGMGWSPDRGAIEFVVQISLRRRYPEPRLLLRHAERLHESLSRPELGPPA